MDPDIARATQNYCRIHAINTIFEFSKEFIQPIIEGFARKKANAASIVEQHQHIVKAFEDKDADRTRKYMENHLNWTTRQLTEYFR